MNRKRFIQTTGLLMAGGMMNERSFKQGLEN
jgi:hypothetical protein